MSPAPARLLPAIRRSSRSILRALAGATALSIALLYYGVVPTPAAPAGVVNPSLEQVTAGQPDCFSRSGWGDGKVNWMLTPDAHTGQVAQSVALSGRVSGERMLLMSETEQCGPGVSAGQAYELSAWYRSTTPATALTVFRHSAAGWTYWTELTALPAAAGWTEAKATTPPVPEGTDQITFGIGIHGRGTLVTDDYSLTPEAPEPPPEPVSPPATVVNPSLEQVSAGQPDCFSRSGWGDNTVDWQLTPDAHTGQVAQSVTISGYVSGDRKLLISESEQCAPAVTAGEAYQLSAWYRSTTAANSLTVFRHSAAGWTYWTDLKALPAAAGWTEAKATTPPVPEGTDQITFGIGIHGDGTLVTDDYSLAPEGGSNPEPSGQLSFNPGLELGGDTPEGWFLAGWGDAAVTAGTTSDAHAGDRAYALTLAGRTRGDFKLLPSEAKAPAVQPGEVYELSVWYRSTSPSNSITLFAHKASGWVYYTELSTLPASASWSQATVETPPIDAGIDAIAWGVSISADGTLITDDYSTTHVGGNPPPPPGGPAAEGRWSVLEKEMPVRSVHTTVLKNGKVLLIAGSGNDEDQFKAGSFKAAVWDPETDTYEEIPVPKDMFCAGHVTLPDGNVLIQGGTKSYPSTAAGADYGGLRDSWIFDPDTNTFTPADEANEGHWYPTLTELGDGDIWMAGGLKEDTTGAVNTEYWDSSTAEWKPGWQIPQTWSFWGLYPHMFLMADGRLFYSGGHTFGNGLPGSGAAIYDWEAPSIAEVPGLRQKDLRDQSASVLLPPAQDQRVMIVGGGNINTNVPATYYCDLIDLKLPTPGYVPGPDLPGEGKMYVNATTLPDRTVLTTNGGRFNRDASANVLTAATYDPEANAWASVAADPIGRNYHSGAVLLPDGRVAVFGSNPGDGSFEMRTSVYEPKYFFNGPRPRISGVPQQATYGGQFSFDVGTDRTIRWAQLMRPMSVTHQTDSNMRLVDLPITVEAGVATVSIPQNPNLLPPGPYMLNVTDSEGIPSESAWVMVG